MQIWLNKTYGLYINRKRVYRLMNQLGIQAQIRKKKRFYGKKEAYIVSDNLLNREFHADRPNQKWVTDITYIPYNQKNLYLSTIYDLYNNEIIAFHISTKNNIQSTWRLDAAAASPGKTVNASAKLAYNLKGLKHNVAVQKSYIGDKYIYVTQRSKGTCYLSRLLISGKDAKCVDQMTVTNTGHCQTLDMYIYKGENYFYFSSKADPSTDQYWSLQ